MDKVSSCISTLRGKLEMTGHTSLIISIDFKTQKLYHCGTGVGRNYLTQNKDALENFVRFCSETYFAETKVKEENETQDNVTIVDIEHLLWKSMEQESMEVQDVTSNNEIENDAELTHTEHGENDVLNSTESGPSTEECVEKVPESEKSSENLDLVQTETEIKMEPDERNSENMENSASIEKSFLEVKCPSPRDSEQEKTENYRGFVSNLEEREEVESPHQTPNLRSENEKKSESGEAESGKGEKGNITDAPSRENVCVFCNKSLMNVGNLFRHVVLHAGKRNLCKISSCHTVCKTAEELQQHLRSHQNVNKPRIILSKYSPQSKLVGHIKFYRNFKVLNFPTKQEPSSSAPTSQKAFSVVYLCTECNRVFKSGTDFRGHKEKGCTKKTEEQSISNFTCKVCARSFPCWETYEKHLVPLETNQELKICPGLKNQQDKGKEDMLASNSLTQDSVFSDSKEDMSQLLHTCNICGEGFTEECNLKAHKSCHKKEKLFHCDICGKGFAEKSYLNYHKRRHLDVRPYKCRYCELAFISNHRRSYHEHVHLNKKSYLCDLCGASFNQSHGLSFHKKIHHNENPPQLCSECGKAFKTEKYLRCHFINKHLKPEDVPNCGFKVHICEVCQKMFSDKRNMRDHMNYHTGVKPYSCPHCNKGFCDKSNLRSHLKRFADKGCVNHCVRCWKRFPNKQELETHLKSHKLKAAQKNAKSTQTLSDEESNESMSNMGGDPTRNSNVIQQLENLTNAEQNLIS